MKGIQSFPWRVEYLQYSQSGKQSRPRILDAAGKPVRLNRPRQAELAALAPQLLEALNALRDRAEMLHLQLQSALGFNTAEPQELVQATKLCRRAHE